MYLMISWLFDVATPPSRSKVSCCCGEGSRTRRGIKQREQGNHMGWQRSDASRQAKGLQAQCHREGNMSPTHRELH
eukprot:7836857-Heterocapsa_arctica.AAC.1